MASLQQHGTLESLVARIFKPVLKHVAHPDDTRDERRAKTIVVPVVMVYLVLYVVYSLNSLKQGQWKSGPPIYAQTVISALYLSWFFKVKRAPVLASEIMIISTFFISIILDMQSRGLWDMWIGLVILNDIVCLAGLRDGVGATLRNLTNVYLVMRSAEEVYHWGLFSFPSDQLKQQEDKITLSMGAQRFLIRFMMYNVDFSMTRWFATSTRMHEKTMDDCVNIATEIADSLVRFDLQQAEDLLNGFAATAAGSENRLTSPLRDLLDNLKMYRPYLPAHLLTRNSKIDLLSQMGDDNDVSSEGEPAFFPSSQPAPQGTATIVFTDIQNSTALWEASTIGMRRALKIHNKVMRRSLHAHNGYEVKTIGDAFMIAFDTPRNAIAFCLEAQEGLSNAEWPKELTAVPEAKDGMKVRMGVHCGDVDAEQNPITKRYDYFGPTVNKAARIESKGIGGAVGATDEVLTNLDPSMYQHVTVGNVALKGVTVNPDLHLLFPPGYPAKKITEAHNKWKVKHIAPPVGDTSPTPSFISIGQVGRKTHTPGVFKARMYTTIGTYGCVELSYGFLESQDTLRTGFKNAHQASNDVITALLDAVERTQGIATAVTGLGCYVTWNIGRACGQHTAQAIRCARLIHDILCVETEDSKTVRYGSMGVSTGRIMHGSVGTEKQRFMVAAGAALNIAQGCARAAPEALVFCLLGEDTDSIRVTADPSTRRATRLLDIWTIRSVMYFIYEVFIDPSSPQVPLPANYADIFKEMTVAEHSAAAVEKFVQSLGAPPPLNTPLSALVTRVQSHTPTLPHPSSLPLRLLKEPSPGWLGSAANDITTLETDMPREHTGGSRGKTKLPGATADRYEQV
eukprot:TRINITY_DN912_c3_g1_i1.p1 TRINITY_DN912_c3_g1~~TRINITY_DN912_c3_g1_i1.p1  ORF type:complete len:853 (+),score=134.61 TRINITY_DN912_c3_g1_i1:48-2606(+)